MEEKMIIRILEKNDGAILQNILKWSRPSATVSLRRCEQLLAQPDNCLIAAMIDNIPVGLIVAYVIQRFRGDVMFLYEIDVHPEHRRKAIARKLIEALKETCRTRKLKEIFVITEQSNVAAMRLYQKTGGHRPHADEAMFLYDLSDH